MGYEAINIHSFDAYKLQENEYRRALGKVQYSRYFSSLNEYTERPTAFISHKHSDLEKPHLLSFLAYLKKVYNVDPYIDSFDKTLPRETSGETAIRIKEKIDNCNKFILFATNDAIDSKWCNWELGIGDIQKMKSDCLVIIPIEKISGEFTGSEYLEIYPYVVNRNAYTPYKLKDNVSSSDEFYVKKPNEYYLEPFGEWLKKKVR